MAIVRFDGERVRCTPVRQEGSCWAMKSLQHAGRLIPGTEFFILDGEVISMGPEEQSIAIDHSLANLEAAMAKERETLPTPAQIIRDNPTIAHDAPK